MIMFNIRLEKKNQFHSHLEESFAPTLKYL